MASVWIDGLESANTVAVSLQGAGVLAGMRASRVVAATAHKIEATAKGFAPVDTGALRNSIKADVQALEATIGTDLDYAGYVEYGTSRMAPRAYLGPALDRHSGEFVAALEDIAGQ